MNLGGRERQPEKLLNGHKKKKKNEIKDIGITITSNLFPVALVN